MTVEVDTASQSLRCAMSYKTARFHCSSKPRTAETSRGPTGTASCSTQRSSHPSIRTCLGFSVSEIKTRKMYSNREDFIQICFTKVTYRQLLLINITNVRLFLRKEHIDSSAYF